MTVRWDSPLPVSSEPWPSLARRVLRGFRHRVAPAGFLPGRVSDGATTLLKGRRAVALSPYAAELDALRGVHKIAAAGMDLPRHDGRRVDLGCRGSAASGRSLPAAPVSRLRWETPAVAPAPRSIP